MTDSTALTDIERVLILGVQARERELAREQVVVQEDWARVRAAIEERLKLPAGAIGTTHGVSTAPWAVTTLPTPGGPPPPETGA